MTKEKLTELLRPIKIVQMLRIEKHPDADRLFVTQVTDGTNEYQVVTGVDNMKVGDFVPYLGVGSVVPGFLLKDKTEITLTKKPLRGIESEGMILAEDEIGMSGDHGGIVVLNSEVRAQNTDEAKVLGMSVIDVIPEVIEKTMKFNNFVEMTPELQKRIDLIKSVADNGGELVGEDQLAGILTSGEKLYTYDGFEPSGQMHIAQGIIRAINTNKMIDAGFVFRMWVADWFGYLNNKMGGDLEKIKDVGRYFIEIWKASGMNIDGVEFLWTSDFVKQPEYWELVMKMAKSSTLNRILRTTEIMGRSEADTLSAAQIIYPCMQMTDIFYVMKCQVTQLGLDQRKVNMLARELGEELGFWKPVVLSHGMLQGLSKPSDSLLFSVDISGKDYGNLMMPNKKIAIFVINKETSTVSITQGKESYTFKFSERLKTEYGYISIDFEKQRINFEKTPEQTAVDNKMSKSKPDTAIFMTDTREDIKRKIIAAYCPPEIVDENPVLAYCKQIIFEAHYLKDKEDFLKNGFEVKREEKFGGNVSYQNYAELEKAYTSGELFPLDLKNAVIEYIDQLLKPVREHFENNAEAKALLEKVQSYQITR